VLAATIISMLLTPLVSGLTAPLYRLRQRYLPQESPAMFNLPQAGLTDHIVIAGGGRVGQHVARLLSQLEVPFVIVEINHNCLEECKQRGFPTIFGDASQEQVLAAANPERAQQLLVTLPNITSATAIVRYVHSNYPDLDIVVRAEGDEQMKALYAAGVHMVILPELEAGLEIARQALLHLKLPVPVIQRYADALRRDHYHPTHGMSPESQELYLLKNARELLDLSWERLGDENLMVGKSLRELDTRRTTGASIVGVLRAGEFVPNPAADFVFTTGDLVAILGHVDRRADDLE
jgi:CPA2 family monovalent cation:H+ antiporter-2